MISDELSALVERVEALERDLENAECERDDYKADIDLAREDAHEADKRADEAEAHAEAVVTLFKRFMQRWERDRAVDDEVLRDMRWTLKAVA